MNKFIVKKYKNKLIIFDNASSHRNQEVKEVIQKDNNLLYAVPYQPYTNVIEGYFSVLKRKLQKNNDIGLEIPKTTYKKLFKGSYERTKKYTPKKSRAKSLKNYK